MPGQLLQGIFGGDDINQSPAAGAYAVQPESALKDLNRYNLSQEPDTVPYKSVQEAIDNGEDIKPDIQYYSPATGDNVTQYVKSPDDTLPMKKPSWLQRAFAPSDAARANSINASYATNPYFAQQQHNTELGFGASDTAKVQSYLNGKQSITQIDPTIAYLANGRRSSAGDFLGTQTQANEYNLGLPAASAAEAIKSAGAGSSVSGNIGRKADAAAAAGLPEAEANADMSKTLVDTGNNARILKYLSQVDANTGKALTAEGGDYDITNTTQPARLSGALSEAETNAKLQAAKATLVPSFTAAMKNRTLLDEIDSAYGQEPTPYGLHVNPDNTISSGVTGFKSPQVGAAAAMMSKGLRGKDTNGKIVNLPAPTPDKVMQTTMSPAFREFSPTVAPAIPPSIKSSLMSRVGSIPSENQAPIALKPVDGMQGYMQDEYGNYYKNGVKLTKQDLNNLISPSIKGKLQSTTQ